jgi:4-hydroxy-tetrahydrodipicolinate synthase
MKLRNGGAYTALVTPFLGEELDLQGLTILVERQIEAGIDGLVVLGSTGEASTLSAEERQQVVRTVADLAKGRCAIVVGTGSNSTAQTLAQTREAQELGADAALVVTPYYNKPSQEGIYRHFQAVDQLGLPLIVYNVASRTGRNIEPATMSRIAQLSNVVGLKESSGDIGQISEMVAIPNLTIWSGDDHATLPTMALGGHGVISVVSNLAPEEIVELVNAMRQGDLERARQKHYQLWPLFRGAFLDTNPVCIKWMLSAVGLPAGSCRLPLCESSEALQLQLAQLAHQYVTVTA